MEIGMKTVSLAVAAIVFGWSAAGACAQLPQLAAGDEKAILCLSQSFTAKESAAVAEAQITGDARAASAAGQAIARAGAACKAALRGDKRRVDIAESVAIEQAIIDLAVSRLRSDGMRRDDGLYEVWSALSADDQSYFLDEQAPADEAFRARLKPLLAKAGVPDSDRDVDGAMLVMECLSNMAVYYRQWLRLDASALPR
jgi:hypothetical protein